MAQMKEIETNNEPSLQPAMLAFGSEKASPYSLANELAEGLVIAKKGMSRKKFLKQYCEGSIDNDFSCAVSVLVGTQDAVHKWLRMSGHARCALWIEHATLEGGHEIIDSSAKLELVYRQQDYRVSHVQVLQECKLVLSPAKQLKSKQSRTKSISEDDCDFDWNGLRQYGLKQMDNRDGSKGMDWWKETTTTRWYILMKVLAFKKLRNMLCPGGALWEFRRLLSQVINLSEFLDIDFQNINLQERLTHHPYAVFLTGRDVIMTCSTSKGIFIWKIVRFDFNQGIVTLAGGETLKGLMYCIKKHDFQKSLIQGIEGHQQTISNIELHEELEHEHSKYCCLDWSVWRGVYRAGPLETILTSAFANEDNCMVLKSLITFFSSWKNKDFCQCCVACDLGTAFRECRGTIDQSSTWKPSSKERCAISNLRSVKQEVRRQGSCTLLDILLHEVRDLNLCGSQKTTLNTARTPRRSTRSTPMSSRSSIDMDNTPLHFQQLDDSKKEVYLEEKENLSLLSGLIAVMDRPLKKNDFKKEKKIIGSETERALQVAKMKWKCFEEMKSNRSNSIGKRTYMNIQHTLRWQQVLEWVDNGFLEILLNEGISHVLEDGKVEFIHVEDLANACLQVVKILPSEGSYRIVNCLVSKLQNFIDSFTTLKIISPQQVGLTKELLIQQKIDKLKISFEETVRFCKLLSLLVKSSVAIASSFVDLDGLFLTLNLYSIIVKEFPIDVNNLDILEHDTITEALPGEVFRLEKYSPKVLKPHASIGEKTSWLERLEKNKSKARLPLQEVIEPLQFSHAFSASKLKVSNVTLANNIQSSIQKTNVVTSKTNVPMTIDGDITIESCMCLPQMLSTLIDVIWETKIHLLQSLANMFESQSITLNKCKVKMRSKLFVEATSLDLLSLLLIDLIGGHANAFPPYISHKLNKLIFKIIFLFEKNLEGNVLHIQGPQENQFNFQYEEDGPWWSGPGPPPTRTFEIRLLGLMLVELKERMDHILAFLVVTIPGHILRDVKKLENYKMMTEDNAKIYIYTLWINLAYLFMVLSDYISYWPAKESKSQHVLQCCGGHFHQTLTLLASLGPVSGWAPAQILTMQSLLKLLSLCIEDSITIDAKENWSEYENFLWKMLVDTWAHWNCIQSYISLITLEICQACLIHNINDFQKSLVEPIYLYYLGLKEKLGLIRNFENFFENFQYSELMPVNAMMFLHLVVLLAQRKFYTYDNSHQDRSAYPCFRNNDLCFLHELMNPLHGLLIMAIKYRPLRTCTNCKIEIINPGFLLEISSRVEQYSLILLTQIFNFKLFPSNVNVQENYIGVCTNVYLSKKYLIHFLHILYASFKNLYTRVNQQTGLNSLCTLQETHSWENENKCPLSNQSSLESSACNDKIICSTMDEVLDLCYLHVQVLHAIAKNLSKDGNQIFKDLCVMDFLVQEISLEYEFSQIADAKLDSKFEMATNSTSSNLLRLSSRKNSNILKGLEDSNSSSNSIGSCCILPNLTQEYELKNSILFCHDYMPQRSSNKCNVNDDNPFVSLKQCKLILDKNNYVKNYSCDSKRKINITLKDANCNDNNNIVKKFPIQLSCNPIYRNINFGSFADRNYLKNIYDVDYNKKKVVYSGRFFDLNEEVERELAIEEDNGLNEGDIQASIEEIESTNIESQIQSKNIKDASISPTSTRSTSCRSVERVIPSTSNTSPWVPKLNFTSALQKAQFNMVSGSDSEILHTGLEEQFCSNEDNNIECKSSNLSASYENERSKRSIYYNSSLHILLLELIIALMLDPQGGLEVCYCDRFPMEHRKINAPFYLSYHINNVNNEYIVPTLAKHLDTFHPSAFRILKLTWRAFFDPSLYTNRVRIAQGALSQIYTATRRTTKDSVSNNELVVLKVVALPKGPHEPCSFFDVYSEVQILERFQGDARVCQILDYGVDHDAFVLVLKHYKCSLRAWRHHHTQPQNTTALSLYQRLPLYLQVYAAVLQAVKALEVQNIVHYDLKCDNILLEPIKSTMSEEDFWQPKWLPIDRTYVIPFRVSITDFGQSKASFVEGGECTARNRGTECVKSPEMLKLLSNNGNVEVGARACTSSLEDEILVGKAGDVWGLGCLLYELLTGEYLLYDEDWVRFFMRVTSSTEELIPDEKAAKLDNNTAIIDFLRFILVRDPSTRPSLDDLILHLEQLQATLRIQSPNDTKLPPQLHDESTTPDIFDELASGTEEDEEPPNQLPSNANARPSQHHVDVYKRCQTPTVHVSKCTFKGHEYAAKRRPRFWRWCCCVCCGRNVKLMR